MPKSRWRHSRRQRAISETIGAILLIGLTIVAGVILWNFRINPKSAPPSVSFQFVSGSSNPAWGDPTDCQPQGHWTYPLQSSQYNTWSNEWYAQCYTSATGNFSVLNASEIIVSAVSRVCARNCAVARAFFVVQSSFSLSGMPASASTWAPARPSP